MATTKLTGTLIRTGSIPTIALGGGVVTSSTQIVNLIPTGTVSSSAQIDYNSIQNKLSGVVSSSTQIQPLLPGGTVSSSNQINTGSFSGSITSASYVSPSGLPAGTVSASGQVVWSSVNYTTGIVSSSTQVQPLLPGGTVSSSAQYPGWMTSSAQVVWSSVNYNAGIMSSSAQTVANISGQYIVPSGSNYQGIVSGSGNQYRLIVPVGTNLYAT